MTEKINQVNSKLKILVTGADGMLGTNIVFELLQRDHEVFCFIESGHDANILKQLAVKIFYGDIGKEEDLVPAFEKCDYIIHTAGYTPMWPARNPLSWKINYDAVKLLVKLSKEYNIKRFVHIGTATSFGHGPIDNPGTESSPYSNYIFKIDYQDTKYEAQQYLLEEFKSSHFPVIILNPTFMLGKYDSGNGSNKMVLYIYQGKLPGYSPGGKNFVNVKDVAVAAANSLKIGRLGECYITAGKNMSYKDGFTFIANSLNVKPPKMKLPRILSYSFGGIQSAIAVITRRPPAVSLRMARIGCEGCYYTPEKAIKELNMPQSSLEDAIHDSIDWFKEIGKV